MPFSPLRSWVLGIVSWVILGVGVYCIWKWAHEPPIVERHVHLDRPVENRSDDSAEAKESVQRQTTSSRTWPWLAAGIALVGLSFGGRLPVSLFLGRPGPDNPKNVLAGNLVTVDRPDGTRLHVEIFGTKSGPTLVFTHGWSLDSTCWGYQLRDLANRFRIVIWDLPGLGHSKGPTNGDYTLEKMAQDLEAVVQNAGKDPVILVGHSIGGMITQTFCRLYPKQLGTRVAGLVLLHTTYINPLRTAFLAALLTAIEKPVLIPLNYLTIWLAPLAWLSNMQSYLNGSLHAMTRFASFAGGQTRRQVDYGAWLAAKAWPAVVGRGNLAMLKFDEQATLLAIEIPVLIIGAEHDRMTKVSASERIEEMVPQGVITRVAAGHLGFWEQHAEVNQLIGEFVEQFAAPHVATVTLQRPHRSASHRAPGAS